MEKRIAIAFALSLLVLFVYNSTFPQKNSTSKTVLLDSQVIVNEEFKINKQLETTSPELEKPSNFSEKITVFENENVKINFSNTGGNIKTIYLKNKKHTFPIKALFSLKEFNNSEFRLLEHNNNEIIYRLDKDDITIVRKYYFDQNNLLNVEIKINGLSKLDKYTVNLLTIDSSKPNNDESLLLAQDKNLFEYSIYSDSGIYRKGSAFKFSNKEDKFVSSGLKWAGFRDRYFCLIVNPILKFEQYTIETVNDTMLDIKSVYDSDPDSQELILKSVIYFGPQNQDVLKSFGFDFDKIISFSNFSVIDIISKFTVYLLHFIFKVTHNWGLAIIIMCFIVYMATYPLTMLSMNAMKRMQTIQPKIAALRDQHKSNPQKLNKELLGLYKIHNVNPLGGCLPFLLQMPIFIGVYQALWRSPDLKGGMFLWIKDLSEPDKLIHFSNSIPLVGSDFNILPIFMGIVAYFQQRISMKNMVVVDESQATQQKIMTIFFPIFLLFIFYNFSSGLNLYFTVFYLMQLLTQAKMSKAKNSG